MHTIEQIFLYPSTTNYMTRNFCMASILYGVERPEKLKREIFQCIKLRRWKLHPFLLVYKAYVKKIVRHEIIQSYMIISEKLKFAFYFILFYFQITSLLVLFYHRVRMRINVHKKFNFSGES